MSGFYIYNTAESFCFHLYECLFLIYEQQFGMVHQLLLGKATFTVFELDSNRRQEFYFRILIKMAKALLPNLSQLLNLYAKGTPTMDYLFHDYQLSFRCTSFQRDYFAEKKRTSSFDIEAKKWVCPGAKSRKIVSFSAFLMCQNHKNKSTAKDGRSEKQSFLQLISFSIEFHDPASHTRNLSTQRLAIGVSLFWRHFGSQT